MPDTVSSLTEVKISELPVADQASATDLLEASQVEGPQFVSRSITLDQVATVVADSDQLAETIGEAIDDIPPLTWDNITGKPATFPPDPEAVDDRVAGLLVAGTNIGITYNDVANSLTINSTTAPVTVPAGTIAFGGVGGVVTGNSTLAWNDTGKNFSITGYTGAAAAFQATGAVPATPAVDVFRMDIVNAGNNTGNVLRLRTGPSAGGLLDAFKVDMAGDAAMTGSCQVLSSSGLVAGGAVYFGYFLGNFSGGTLGLWGGSGAPTFSTGGKKGGLYLDATGAIPWYNVDGGTTWARLGGSVNVGTTPPASPSDGQLWYYSDAVNGGGALYIRYNDGNTTQWVPASPAATPGSLLQTVFVETGAVATGTTIIPADDTPPQNTEGDQYMQLTITPKSATSKLIIEVAAQIGSGAAGSPWLIAALFQDSTANALAVGAMTSTQNSIGPVGFRHTMTSGTTSATTFKVRCGSHLAGTTTFNGNAGNRQFGGVMASSIVIQEVA